MAALSLLASNSYSSADLSRPPSARELEGCSQRPLSRAALFDARARGKRRFGRKNDGAKRKLVGDNRPTSRRKKYRVFLPKKNKKLGGFEEDVDMITK